MVKDRRSSSRRSPAGLAVALALAACAWSQPAAGATIAGSTTASVVWVSVPSLPEAAGQFDMINHDKSFEPDLLVVPAGSNVRFPNQDPFYHSIYSTAAADPFDIGFYETGPGKVVAFPKPGIIDVHCHIHAFMHATIVVVDGPSAQVSGGRYRLDDVPPGKHTLHSWDLQHGERTTEVTVPSQNATVDLDLPNS